MSFEPTDEQVALRDVVRQLCADRFPITTVRALEGSAGVDRAGWQELSSAGVFAMRLGEDAGGAGMTLADAVIVYEELGRALVPGPVIATFLAAEYVDGAADGSAVVGFVDRTRTPLTVMHLEALDAVLVLDDDGVEVVPAGQVRGTPLEPFDPWTAVHRVDELSQGKRVGDASLARRMRREGAVLAAAMCVGSAAASGEASVQYARERHQFGRPIGSFQAVKHMLADMVVRTELARAAVYGAAAALGGVDPTDVDRAVAAAKVIAAEAAVKNARASIQVYGGMGFTWEVDAHLHLRRAWVLEGLFGTSDQYADAVALAL